MELAAPPQSYWIPWLARVLEEKGYRVTVPQLPYADKPDLRTWLPFALTHCKFDTETIVIGHSAGCPLILSLLEGINTTIRKAILVAGFCLQLDGTASNPIIQESYQWNKIKMRAKEFVFINSDNDPWGCDDKQGRFMRKQLGGKFILAKGEGHMESDTYNQPYKEFPLLLKLIE